VIHRRTWTGALALAVGAAAHAAQDRPPTQKEVSRELERLFGEHFEDQGGTDEALVSRRQAERRDRVLEIVAAGQLASLEDWDHAAVILQYGIDPEDFLLAHALAIPPGIEDLSLSRQLVAATLDHYLQSTGRAEVFGTMSATPSAEGLLRIGPAGEPAPDSLRRLFQLDRLPGRGKKGKGPPAKGLAKIPTSGPGSDPAEWLPSVRAIVAGGEIESAKDYAAAARLLLGSPEESDLLLAHVLALAAAFEEHEEGMSLAAETLDRFLIATGRGQLLESLLGAAGEPVEPRKPAPEVVLHRFAGGMEAGR
jgi:hypothetical protein